MRRTCLPATRPRAAACPGRPGACATMADVECVHAPSQRSAADGWIMDGRAPCPTAGREDQQRSSVSLRNEPV